MNLNMNLWTIFFTGLFTGGLTCLAVQGGLLATTLAQRQEAKLQSEVKKKGNAVPILVFLAAKLTAYTLLGALLGWFGSLFQFSLTVKVIMQFAVGIFMLGTALNFLEIHPIFRYFVIAPPKFLTRMIRREAKSADMFAPALLGAFTIFIPCGTTQAMMALSIASGNPILGATILFVFILGTSPLFFILGYFASRLGDMFQKTFMKVAAAVIMVLAIFTLNGAVSLTGSSYTLENIWGDVSCTVLDICSNSKVLSAATEPLTEATIYIDDSGYTPANLSLKAGSPVTLHLVNRGGRGCTQAFTIPGLGIQKIVRLGTTETIKFTAPKDLATLPFMCSMGMFRGEFAIKA